MYSLSSSKSFFSSNHSFNTIVHIMNQIFFTSTESPSVGNIENTIVSFGVFTVDSSDLNVEFVSNFVELLFVLSKHWEFNVDGCSESCTKIGWAGSDVT